MGIKIQPASFEEITAEAEPERLIPPVVYESPASPVGLSISGDQALRQAQQTHSADRPDAASLYRTQWLMAHNHLHALFYEGGLLKSEEHRGQWDDYLDELQSAEEIASRLA